MRAEIPVLPVCAFAQLPDTILINEDDTVGLILKKVEQLKSAQLLNKLYRETGDATVSQLIPDSNVNLTEITELQQPQTLLIKQFAEGVRTGVAVLNSETILEPGECILQRFDVIKSCGEATFSNCYEVYDRVLLTKCCIKVIKEEKEYLDQSIDEIRLLELVKKQNGA